MKSLAPRSVEERLRFCVVCDLVAHAWFQRELSPVFELGVKLTFWSYPRTVDTLPGDFIASNGSGAS